VHGYDAVALARWLGRDRRLPLTSHAVSDDDAQRVWEVFCETASEEEREEMMAGGELVRDHVTGELRRADAQGATSRLQEPTSDGDLACLDWPFFLAEIERLQHQISHARNAMLRDRSFAKKAGGDIRMQHLAELQVRVEARRRQFVDVTGGWDAQLIMADLYQMEEVVKAVQAGAPLPPLLSETSDQHGAAGGEAGRRLLGADAEHHEESEDDFDYDDDSSWGGGGHVGEARSSIKASRGW